MDAAALSPARKRELADLRSRAYGPDADIHLDEGALARLNELEQLARPEQAALTPSLRSGPPVSAPSLAEATATVPAAVALEATAAAHTPADADSVLPPSWWRRVPMWAIVAIAAIVVAATLAIANLLQSSPDATLQIVADVDTAQVQPRELLEWYKLDADSLRRHDDFHGIRVWSATNEQGSKCLLLSVDSNWTNATCTPAQLEPMLDYVLYEGMPPIEGLDLPVGSVLRFQLQGDVVEVVVAPAREEAIAPAPTTGRRADDARRPSPAEEL